MAPLWSPWNEDKIEVLRRLWAAGASAGDIAKEIGDGISRNAVIGKVNRLGLERCTPERPRKPRDQVVKRGRPILRRPVFISPPPKPELPPERPEHEAPPPRPRRLQLLQLEDGQCHWPIGDPRKRAFYFCGVDCRSSEEVYCEYHMRKAYKHPRR